MSKSLTNLSINAIRRDVSTQNRAGIDRDRVEQYAENLSDLPPPVVFHDGETYWAADGFHRIEAYLLKDRARIACIVRKGNDFDAFLFGLEANAKHDRAGLHRSSKDKRHSVVTLFAWLKKRDEDWSDRKIADACGVGYSLVADLRPQLPDSGSSQKRTGSDGKRRKAPTPRVKLEPSDASTAPSPDQNAFLTLQHRIGGASTRAQAEAAYSAVTVACGNGEIGETEAEELAGVYRHRITSIEDESDEDSEPETTEEELEVIEPDESVPDPVIRPEAPAKGWGAIDVSSQVIRIINVSRDYQRQLTAEFDQIDPRFRDEVTKRVEDVLLETLEAVANRLPVDGRRAADNRSRFLLVPGGK